MKYLVAFALVTAKAGCLSETSSAPGTLTLTAADAGAHFGEMCLSAYPDQEAALAVGRRRFPLDFVEVAERYEVLSGDIKVRITDIR